MYRRRRRYKRVRLTPLGVVVVICVITIIASLSIWGAFTISNRHHRASLAHKTVKKPSLKPLDAVQGGRTQDIINEIDKNIGDESSNDNMAVTDELVIVKNQITTLSTVGDSIDAATLQ